MCAEETASISFKTPQSQRVCSTSSYPLRSAAAQVPVQPCTHVAQPTSFRQLTLCVQGLSSFLGSREQQNWGTLRKYCLLSSASLGFPSPSSDGPSLSHGPLCFSHPLYGKWACGATEAQETLRSTVWKVSAS